MTTVPPPDWMPPNAAAHGFAVDHLLRANLLAVSGLFILAHLLIAVLFLRRSQLKLRPAAWASHEKVAWSPIEIIALLLLCLMYLGMAVTGQRLWAKSRFEGAAPASMQVEVTGRQFQWYFRYPGADAEFGETDPTLIAPAEGNPLGISPVDEHGRDDLVASELVLPVNREVDLTLRSQDVVHGFFIPSMRLQQNAVPGLLLHVHFMPIATGTYLIECAQVCGLGHARMQARLRVLSSADFQNWLQSRYAAAHRQAAS